MIVASLLLILVAVALLVFGLAGGSSLLLTTSIAASLLAALALVAGARRAAASRAAAGRPDADASRFRRPPAGRTGQAGPDIPTQHVPATDGTDDAGWRQPPGSSVPAGETHAATSEVPSPDEPPDEPPALRVSPADAALVAGLDAEVLVVDGRPRYHLADCPHLLGRDAEALPVSEAVALGFTPCARCAPDTSLLADTRPR
ncbi:hypothetical protein ACFY2R_08210 [Micromonospora olivasterospora]|uniref:Uncharacterized protein n=1 Tax=Micromonospora olivasterospora TaxID=1880 RepID=A0A562I4J1_MICOL|nr:hypothetical protein [Micromonospora olivasterospora]TWH65658.1 hypothetical protein JD77_00596 [Micromonospora olivasterospora]